jgi:hypothetical protein
VSENPPEAGFIRFLLSQGAFLFGQDGPGIVLIHRLLPDNAIEAMPVIILAAEGYTQFVNGNGLATLGAPDRQVIVGHANLLDSAPGWVQTQLVIWMDFRQGSKVRI